MARPHGLPVATAIVLGAVLVTRSSSGETVPVRFSEGLVHGFLTLSSSDGAHLADGDLIQTARGDRVTSRLVFHFADGSLYDETTVFRQRGQFAFVSDHLRQKGHSFPHEIDMAVDASGQAIVKYTGEHGELKTAEDHFGASGDLANGMVLTLLKNVRSEDGPRVLSMVIATPKPLLVKLKVSNAGVETFSTGREKRRAVHYVLKVDLGGLRGLIAPLIGKQPPDVHVWISQGEAPAFLKSEQTFFAGGPLWRTEPANVVWPRHTTAP